MRSALLARVVLSAASLAAIGFSAGCRTTGAAGGVARAEQPSVAPGGPDTRSESRLASGLRVVVEEDHAAPTVAIQVWVASGAADDPPALAGSAHFIERLVLRGTGRRPPGAAAQEIAAAGGTIGAWTGLDETVFHVVLGASYLDLGLDVLGDALTAPAFAPAELERERQAVLDEVARAAGDPAAAATAALRAEVFAGAPDGRSLLGTAAEVALRSRPDLLARFAESYVGSNMTVVVVGDVQTAAARAAVARAFAGVREGPPAHRAGSTPAPSPPAARVTLLRQPALGAELAIGWRIPVADAADAAALDLLAAVLARGEGARLDREVVRNQQLATSVRAFTFLGRDGALLALSLSPMPRRAEAAARAAIEEVLRLGREAISAEELEAARQAVKADLGLGEAGLQGRARRLGYAAALARELDWPARYGERLASVAPGDLQTVAARLLRSDALALAVVDPDRADAQRRAELEQIVAGAAERVPLPASPPVATIATGDLVRLVEPSGLRIVALREPGAPLVSVEAAWAGAAGSLAADDGIAALISTMFALGTRTRSIARLTSELQTVGGSLAGFADGDRLGLRAEFLPARWQSGLGLVADCLLRPSFPSQAIDAERRLLVDRASSEGDRPAGAAWQLFERTLRSEAAGEGGGHERSAALAAMTRIRLLDLYRRRYPPSELVVAVVGDLDPAPVAAALGRLFADLPPRSAGHPFADPPPRAAAVRPDPAGPDSSRAEPVTAVGTASGDLAELVLGYPGPSPRDPDRLAVEVLAGVLDADGGPLKRALGVDPPLAYRVGARAAPPDWPGFLAVSLSSAPARLDDAVAAVRGALARLVAAGVTASEIEPVARRLAGAAAVRLASRAAVADALALDEAYGRPLLDYRQVPAALARITPDEVTRAARRWLDPKREVIAVVRPPDEAAARRRPGPGREER